MLMDVESAELSAQQECAVKLAIIDLRGLPEIT